MLSLICPFIDNADLTLECLSSFKDGLSRADTELVLIDNGSDERLTDWPEFPVEKYVYNKTNLGVLPTFKQGLLKSTGDILCFIHNDILVHEEGWDSRIQQAFDDDPLLGVAGFFGARGTGTNGGREGSMSHMLGSHWGKVEGVQPAALHHGEVMTGVSPAAGLDGLAMIFKRTALEQLVEHSDMFAEWRAPHHFYDRTMVCKLIEMGWHCAVIGIAFDHWSGATANSSEKYQDTARRWATRNNVAFDSNWDHSVYLEAERQFFKEFGNKLALRVDDKYNYTWRGR